MPNTSKLGFTKQHYTLKPPQAPANYDPNNNTITVTNTGNNGPQQSNGSSGYAKK